MNHSIGPIDVLFALVLILGGLVLYFLPTIIARQCNHSHATAIAVLNLFTGWTFAGWVASLVWACTGVANRQSDLYDYTPISHVPTVENEWSGARNLIPLPGIEKK